MLHFLNYYLKKMLWINNVVFLWIERYRYIYINLCCCVLSILLLYRTNIS
jgi:hypothetical protein